MNEREDKSLREDEAADGAADRSAMAAATLSQWQLIRRRFARHRVAVASLFVVGMLYTLAIFAEFFAPYSGQWYNLPFSYAPPQPPRFSLRAGLHTPAVRKHVDPVTQQIRYTLDRKEAVPLGFFVRGDAYRLWGLIPCDRHFFGVDTARGNAAARPTFYLLGADKYGRDIFSRIVYGARVSLSVGLTAIVLTFLLGVTIGGISGYVGGAVDNLIQRLIEVLGSLPRLPLWMALGAAVPPDWSPLRAYFAITLLLALLGWTGLARVVRGKFLALREEDYAVAAGLLGAGHGRIIFRHLLPGFTSHIIVALTLSVPGMILGETSLSFLGLGLREPVVSWGVLLQDCLNVQVIADYPWMLMPAVFLVLFVLSCNFTGDGLRDAADPYSTH
jgi:peptide/nickel transport system permease protein